MNLLQLSPFYEPAYFFFRKCDTAILCDFWPLSSMNQLISFFRKSTALFSLSSMSQLISFSERLVRYFLCLLWTNLFPTYFFFRKSTAILCLSSMNQLRFPFLESLLQYCLPSMNQLISFLESLLNQLKSSALFSLSYQTVQYCVCLLWTNLFLF